MGLLNEAQTASVYYHGLFDYPLTEGELKKWEYRGKSFKTDKVKTEFKNGYFFLEGRETTIQRRGLRERVSEKKLAMAGRAGKVLGRIPTVGVVAVTGSLAMQNAKKDSDIDLMIITQAGTLWLTRLVVLVTLMVFRIPTRRFGNRNQKDKLCLNLWLDETDLVWPKRDRNAYTAHEIAQIIPLVNKHRTYEWFIDSNRWILDWWPKAVKMGKINQKRKTGNNQWVVPLEKAAYWIQYLYMRRKITKEVITSTRAVFHPRRFPLDNFESFLIQ